MGRITRFRDQYVFLSNFYHSPIEEDGYSYPTVEHYYQSKKPIDSSSVTTIRNASSPRNAKYLGGKCSLRVDWEDIKDSIMERALRLKFDQNPDLKRSLVATGSDELIEGNSWGDTYWGVNLYLGNGLNKLGQLLMKIREKYN